MKKKTALITARFTDDAMNLLLPFLDITRAGYGMGQGLLSDDDFLLASKDVDILIVELQSVTDKVIQANKNLELIGSCRGTPNNVDLNSASERGIPVLNAPGRNAVSVAELCLTLMMMLSRNVKQAMVGLADGNWGTGNESPFIKYRGVEIYGKTIGIIGFGAIGREVAKRTRLLGMKVIVYDPFVNEDQIISLGATPVPFDTLLENSDFVSLHAKLTDQTKGILGVNQFAKMKRTSILINTASGLLVDENALISALEQKQIAGAGLDVFAEEPIQKDSPLLKFEHVVALPHIGGATSDVSYHQAMIMAEDVKRYLTGENPLNIYNAQNLEVKRQNSDN